MSLELEGDETFLGITDAPGLPRSSGASLVPPSGKRSYRNKESKVKNEKKSDRE